MSQFAFKAVCVRMLKYACIIDFGGYFVKFEF